MNDFETRLGTLLNEDVDARVGPSRPAPPHRFDRPSAPRSSGPRARWLPPLLAAACVALIVGGGVAGTQLLSSDHTPAGPRTGVPTVLPAPSTSAVPTPTTARPTPTHPATHHPAPRTQPSTAARTTAQAGADAPATHTVQLGAASISLPAGWVARDYQRYLPKGRGASFPSWCIARSSDPVSTKFGTCALMLAVPTVDNRLDVDIEGGYSSNPSSCGAADFEAHLESADRTLGGRAAEWRQWRIDCSDGKVVRYEQYEVPTGQAYILFSDQVDATIHDTMTQIAQHSTLPAQTDPLRWMDRGFVRSVRRTGDSVGVTLDRAVSSDGITINKNPATYHYSVPLAVWRDASSRPRVGSLLTVQTDGRHVLDI